MNRPVVKGEVSVCQNTSTTVESFIIPVATSLKDDSDVDVAFGFGGESQFGDIAPEFQCFRDGGIDHRPGQIRRVAIDPVGQVIVVPFGSVQSIAPLAARVEVFFLVAIAVQLEQRVLGIPIANAATRFLHHSKRVLIQEASLRNSGEPLEPSDRRSRCQTAFQIARRDVAIFLEVSIGVFLLLRQRAIRVRVFGAQHRRSGRRRRVGALVNATGGAVKRRKLEQKAKQKRENKRASSHSAPHSMARACLFCSSESYLFLCLLS